VIASGLDDDALRAVVRGEPVGTYVAARGDPLSARRHWMAAQKGIRGSLVVDDGALRALRERASLLPSGIVEVRGRFQRGDLVSVVDGRGVERARGIVRFDDRDVDQIRGLHTNEIPEALGIDRGSVVMRPDRMVLLDC